MIPGPLRPRAHATLINVGDRSARALDVAGELRRRARGHGAPFLAAEQRPARAIGLRVLPRPERPAPRACRAVMIDERLGARAFGAGGDDEPSARDVENLDFQRATTCPRERARPCCPARTACFAAGHRAPGPCSFGHVLARWSAHGRECRFSFSFVAAAGAWGALRKNQLHRRQRVEAAASGRATRAGGEHSAAAKPRRRRLSQKGAAAAGPAARRRWSQLARVRGMMEGVPRGCPLRLTFAERDVPRCAHGNDWVCFWPRFSLTVALEACIARRSWTFQKSLASRALKMRTAAMICSVWLGRDRPSRPFARSPAKPVLTARSPSMIRPAA